MFPGSRLPPRTLGCLVAAAGLAVGGCGTLPAAGPSASQIVAAERHEDGPQPPLIDIDERVVAVERAAPAPSLVHRFPAHGVPGEPTIGVGDGVVVSIWEAAAGGLFSSAPGDQPGPGSHSVVLPEQVVGRDGAISVPFAGRIACAGRLPLEVQRAIERRLAGKAIEPQAIVSVEHSVNDTATVTGEVIKGAVVPLSLKGDRLLDLIASAGGAKTPVYETSIRLSRGAVTATIPMERLVADPAENIYAEPGDVLTVVRSPQSFTVLGAAGQNSEIPFPAARLSLIEALGRAGGLQDFRSDPAGVFLFRWESPAVVEALGVAHAAPAADGRIGVIYRLDLGNPRSYLAAQQFAVRDKDVLYIANAGAIELQKFMNIINGLTGPAVTGAVIKNATQ
ncbi:MAG TPA: polysaccharide biosynthesis/export family protein [Stellaceae bacterium]|nr:polysaccharide biosynthesis/export family protein [Stellaceae bacterium]